MEKVPISYFKSDLKCEDEIEREGGRGEIFVLWKEYMSARTGAVHGQTKNEENETRTHVDEMEENTREERQRKRKRKKENRREVGRRKERQNYSAT